MIDTVRKYVEAGMGALSSKRAEDLARALVNQGQARREQAARIARDLLDWSRRNRERLVSTTRSEVKKQISALGVATKDDVDALKKRVRELEGKRTTTRKTTRKSTSRKRAARA